MVQDEPEKVYVRVRLPKDMYDAVVVSSVEAGVPLGSYLAMMVAAAHKALTGTGPGLVLPRPRSKSELRRLEAHDRELIAEAERKANPPIILPPMPGHPQAEVREEAEEKRIAEEVLQTYSPEPGTRHWHRINDRKAKNAKRLWFEKGVEMGEFICECGKVVERQVQR